MAYLYVNSKGQEIRRHSYSAGDTFHFCNKKYELQRKRGYREKEQRASMAFGKAIEDAVRFYHLTNNCLDAVGHFSLLWEALRNEPLVYTATEVDWQSLLLSGQELIRLYHLKLPWLPFKAENIKFQTELTKEVFPQTDLAGIEFVAYVDMIAEAKTGGNIVIDIKTSGTMLDTTPGIHALDQQLRSYSWITGIAEVGFLVLVKTDRGLSKGSWVSLLQGVEDPAGRGGEFSYNAGNMAIVAQAPKGDDTDMVWIVKPTVNLDDLKAAGGERPNTKGGKFQKSAWMANNAALVPKTILTKQRIQFLPATVDAEAQQEAADQIGEDITLIVRANQSNKWKKQGGTRYPNNKCSMCSMRGICLKDDRLRDELLTRDDILEWDGEVFG